MRRRSIALTAGVSIGLLGAGGATATATAATVHSPRVKHVLLLSVDGLHQSDLARYVTQHPHSALAALVARGTEYTRAQTTFPSDSFPGMVAQLTGGGPGTTNVYYDDTYNHALLPAGTLNCSTAARGTEVPWTEAIDRSQNPITLDAGQKINDPALTSLREQHEGADAGELGRDHQGHPEDDADAPVAARPGRAAGEPGVLHAGVPAQLPPGEHRVRGRPRARAADGVVGQAPGLRDPRGPSGTGVQDLFTPEINGVADSAGDDWSTDNALTQEYDGYKVAAVLNEIDGLDHSGARKVGTPAVFGMNFQTVSTAQKLPTSDGLTGGYNPDGSPGPLLSRAMDDINAQVGTLRARSARQGLDSSTTIILSAKHGQSPTNRTALRRVDDAKIVDDLNAAWASTHPKAAPLVTFSVNDDGMLMWLSDRSPAALGVRQGLPAHPQRPGQPGR